MNGNKLERNEMPPHFSSWRKFVLLDFKRRLGKNCFRTKVPKGFTYVEEFGNHQAPEKG